MLTQILSYVLVGIIFLVILGCAVTPVILDSMSKEEREAAGIVWKEDN
jgi:uncharacterized membrane protein